MGSPALKKIGLATALVLGCGGLIGWLASRPNTKTVATAVETEPADVVTAPALKTSDKATRLSPTVKQSSRPAPSSRRTHALAGAEPSGEWEKKVDEILLSEIENDQKSEKLFGLMTNATEEVQVEVVQHALNFVVDSKYQTAAQILTNAQTPESVLNLVFADLLNRNDKLKLPTLVDLARDTRHPLRGEARELLELYVQHDYGTNWEQWGQAVQGWLKENAE
jgi:hypothetical protein